MKSLLFLNQMIKKCGGKVENNVFLIFKNKTEIIKLRRFSLQGNCNFAGKQSLTFTESLCLLVMCMTNAMSTDNELIKNITKAINESLNRLKIMNELTTYPI